MQLLVPIFIVSTRGVADQGLYAISKNHFDLILALLVLGLPQGILVAQGNAKTRVDTPLVFWHTLTYVLFASPAILAIAYYTQPKLIEYSLYAVFVLIGVMAIACRDIWRGTYIEHNDAGLYAIYSIIPSAVLGLTAVVSFSVFADTTTALTVLYAVGGITALLVSLAIYREKMPTRLKVDWRIFKPILTNSFDGFIQTVVVLAQAYLFYYIIQKSAPNASELTGILSIGFLIVQGLMTPMQMVAPLIIRRWMPLATDEIITHFKILNRIFYGLLLLSSLACVLLLKMSTVGWFEDARIQQALQAALLLPLIPAAFLLRIEALVCAVRFNLKPNVAVAVVKTMISVLIFLLLNSCFGAVTLLNAAIALVVGEYVAIFVGMLLIRKLFHIPLIAFFRV
ncbi:MULTISPECIES: hypothetical protein [unclassified Acinetobacter]|uniref:hypothetical protein n=1 Tax=unclassified Acinetobacter TaxID=196816 RepID=UPI0035B9BE89